MKTSRPLRLSRLRDIGFADWDPIGLLAKGDVWNNKPFADEYDSYLLEAAGRLQRDWAFEDAVNFLMEIERDHMGLGLRATSRPRAEATAKAIRAYLGSAGGPISD